MSWLEEYKQSLKERITKPKNIIDKIKELIFQYV